MKNEGIVIEMTSEDIKQLIADAARIAAEEISKRKERVYGISGLAELLGCSRTVAQTIKSSGAIDDAVTQVGRQIIIDAEHCLELLKNKQDKRKRKRYERVEQVQAGL